MKEMGRILDEMHRERALVSYREEIIKGLDLENAPYFKERRGVWNVVVNDILQTLLTTNRELVLPYPSRILLKNGWHEKSEETEGEGARDIIADATVSPLNPNGLIRYSRFYLRDIVVQRLGIEHTIRDYRTPRPIEAITAHENYHRYQFKHDWDQAVKDSEKITPPNPLVASWKPDLNAWEQTVTEQGALLYEKQWFEKFDNLRVFDYSR